MQSPQRILVVEGWRFVPHSYAMVNQQQLLEFRRRGAIALYHRDLPYFAASWRPTRHLFAPRDQDLLDAIPAPPADLIADSLLRIASPLDLTPSTARRTFVFATSEYGAVPDNFMKGGRPLRSAHADSDVVIVTPSNWSKRGLLASGADPSRVAVVPHGVDTSIFHPVQSNARAALRRALGWDWDGFTFLHVGAMTGNKGMDGILKCFAVVTARHPDARLVLKGTDALYPSQALLKHTIGVLNPTDRARVAERLRYLGGTMSMEQVARLYQAADAYVSPYRAEGFNLPVLEAIACGLPVICTAGGPTDDFTDPAFTLRIQSRLVPPAGNMPSYLLPDGDHLLAAMQRVVVDPTLATRAREAGPAFVERGFTWGHVVDRLTEVTMNIN